MQVLRRRFRRELDEHLWVQNALSGFRAFVFPYCLSHRLCQDQGFPTIAAPGPPKALKFTFLFVYLELT